MDHETPVAPKRRLSAYGRVVRRGRIFARLREGWAHDEIAQQEGLTAERVRQIVAEVLRKRPVDSRSDHLKVQLARLAPALRLAGEAIARGDIKAIAPYLKTLDRIARCHEAAAAGPEGGGPRITLADVDGILAGVEREEDAMRATLARTWAAGNPATGGGKEKSGLESPQPIEKSQFGRENPRKSK
jgi:hypothetical protein